MEPKKKKIITASIIIVAGFILSFVPFMYASICICGISGCSGGGYGIAIDPTGTLMGLIAAGVIASMGFFIAAKILGLKKLVLGGVAVLVAVPILAGLLIGSDWNGYPKDICIVTYPTITTRSGVQYDICGRAEPAQIMDECVGYLTECQPKLEYPSETPINPKSR